MSDELRTFECRLENGAERVLIEDVIVYDENICLVVRGLRGGRRYIFQVLPRGFKMAHPDTARAVEAMHEEELLRFQSMQEPEPAHAE